MIRDRELDRLSIKVVLRWRLSGPLKSYYGGWRSSEVAARSCEALLDDAADEILRMLCLNDDVVSAGGTDDR